MSDRNVISLLVSLLLGLNTWQDLRKREILPLSLWGFLGAGILLNLYFQYQSLGSMAAGAVVGGVMLLISKMSRGAIGTGDGFLLCVTGIYLGLLGNLTLLLVGLFLCGLFSVGLFMLKKVNRNTGIPFVPFLLFAYLGGLLF